MIRPIPFVLCCVFLFPATVLATGNGWGFAPTKQASSGFYPPQLIVAQQDCANGYCPLPQTRRQARIASPVRQVARKIVSESKSRTAITFPIGPALLTVGPKAAPAPAQQPIVLVQSGCENCSCQNEIRSVVYHQPIAVPQRIIPGPIRGYVYPGDGKSVWDHLAGPPHNIPNAYDLSWRQAMQLHTQLHENDRIQTSRFFTANRRTRWHNRIFRRRGIFRW